MKKITKIEVLYALSHASFNKQAKEFIKQGWQPFGGIAYSSDDFNQEFVQTFVKYEDEQ